MKFKDFLRALGLLNLIGLIAQRYSSITLKTETRLISKEAIKILHNRNKTFKIRKVIYSYHETGKWDISQLKNLIEAKQ